MRRPQPAAPIVAMVEIPGLVRVDWSMAPNDVLVRLKIGMRKRVRAGCCATVPADTVTVSLATKRRTGLACVTVGAGDRSVVDTIGSIPRWFDNGDRVR